MPANDNVSPRSLGRQLHIPRMAIAAAAIILLLATHVRASIAYFVVDSQSSWLQETRKLVGPALGGTKTGVPQSLGSDTTHFFGDMYVDIQDTTIQLLPAHSISAMVTGDYAPHDYVFQDPPGDPYPVGVTPQANYGISLPAIGGSIVQYNVRLDIRALRAFLRRQCRWSGITSTWVARRCRLPMVARRFSRCRSWTVTQSLSSASLFFSSAAQAAILAPGMELPSRFPCIRHSVGC